MASGSPLALKTTQSDSGMQTRPNLLQSRLQGTQITSVLSHSHLMAGALPLALQTVKSLRRITRMDPFRHLKGIQFTLHVRRMENMPLNHTQYRANTLTKFGYLNSVLPLHRTCRLTLVPSVAGLHMSLWRTDGLWGLSRNCCFGCHSNTDLGFGGQERDKSFHLVESQFWILIALCMGQIGGSVRARSCVDCCAVHMIGSIAPLSPSTMKKTVRSLHRLHDDSISASSPATCQNIVCLSICGQGTLPDEEIDRAKRER
jgi:hypothetical protein